MEPAVATIATVRTLLIAVLATVGAVIAALWPRVAYRLSVPFGQAPRVTCLQCHRSFARGWRGWIHFGTPCQACRAVVRYWWVASVCAAAATAVLTWRLSEAGRGQTALLVMWLVVVQAMTLLSLIDIAVHRLPTVLVTTTALAVSVAVCAAAWLAHRPQWILSAVLAAGGLGGIYLLVALLIPSQLGMGDVRLAAVLGDALGVGGWDAMLLGAALPYVVAFPFALAQRARRSASEPGELVFGPFLAIGAIAAASLIGA